MTAQTTNTSKKTTKPKNPTAEEVRENTLSDEELLADMPKLRAPERLRLRHKNALKTIGFRYQSKINELGIEQDENGDSELSYDQAFLLLDIAVEIDEWAESLADDPAAYVEWSESKSDNPEVFLAIMTRYMEAMGESNGSAN